VTVPNTVNIMVTMKSTAASFSGAGIGFRVPTTGDDDYSFHISSTGACTATDEVTDVVFFNNTSCSAVATGANAVNTLKITQSGAQMNFYVNGTQVGSANDATLSTGGIALQVGTNTSMVFNNFVLTQLQ
jgi:hypothetical protein